MGETYRNFPGHSMCCRCESCENANANPSAAFPDSTPPTSETRDRGGVEEIIAAIKAAVDEPLWRVLRDSGLSQKIADAIAALRNEGAAEGEPIPMLLYCPKCGEQHIDEPDERTPGWTNPPHRSHLCHACGCIWRPADVATVGVRHITTLGKADTWAAAPASPAGEMKMLVDANWLSRKVEADPDVDVETGSPPASPADGGEGNE